MICAALVAAGGIAGSVGIVNPRRTVRAESCPGGQLVGIPEPAIDPRSVSGAMRGGALPRGIDVRERAIDPTEISGHQ